MMSYGDIPEKDRKLVEELRKLEQWFYGHGAQIQKSMAAKGFTSIAHDYYFVDFEEEGDRLIYLAEKMAPGYFRDLVYVHMGKDPEFYKLMIQLSSTQGGDLVRDLGFNEELV